ncbi:lasso peptide biosynthesis B2 protein [Streptomyces noursei]|uniref:lasso peptide biosynthesis B2 protein n=1 Tax=Streptomyces noursei TaxID=1971 RepID=UPI0036D28BD1
MAMTAQVYTAVLPDGAAAVMDIRDGRGRWLHLSGAAGRLWHQHIAGRDLNEAADLVTEHFVKLGAHRETVRADLAAQHAQLRERGLLRARTATSPLERCRVRAAPADDATAPLADRIAGVVGLAASLILLRCVPFRCVVFVAHLLSRLPGRLATAEEAENVVVAVRCAGRPWPGRSACLEQSLGCFLAMRLRGRRLLWSIGARSMPTASHTWVEADGQVIGQDLKDEVWPYRPAMRI